MRILPVVALCAALLPASFVGASPSGPSSPFGTSSASSFLGAGADVRDVLLGRSTASVAGARGAGGGWLDEPSTGRPPRRAVGSAASRTAYLGYQTALSTYVYGVGVPLGLGFESPRALIATPLIVAPLAFGVHLATTSQLDFTEAHVKASFYAPTAAAYSATALSLAFSSDAGDGYRIGSLIGAGAYPLGLWYGRHLGDRYRATPETLDHKMMFALGYGFLGFVTPVLYFERPSRHSEDILRIGLGQSVGMAAAGHFIADYYRPQGHTSGVNMGLATHAALGGLGGVAVAAYADASNTIRPWLGAAVIGTTLGFTEGVYFFNGSRDSQERSQYAALGAAGGAMMGLGIQILTYDGDYSAHAHKISWASFLVGGAFLGYATTYALTGHLVETAALDPRRETDEAPSRWALDPLPVPEVVMSRGEPATRWKVPGVTVRF